MDPQICGNTWGKFCGRATYVKTLINHWKDNHPLSSWSHLVPEREGRQTDGQDEGIVNERSIQYESQRSECRHGAMRACTYGTMTGSFNPYPNIFPPVKYFPTLWCRNHANPLWLLPAGLLASLQKRQCSSGLVISKYNHFNWILFNYTVALVSIPITFHLYASITCLSSSLSEGIKHSTLDYWSVVHLYLPINAQDNSLSFFGWRFIYICYLYLANWICRPTPIISIK